MTERVYGDDVPRSRVGAAVALAVMVIGVPLTCLAGFALYGKTMSEGQVAEGRVLSVDEMRARLEVAQRAFRSLPPEQHITSARQALARGYDPELGIGGQVAEALRHLDAIPEGAAVGPEVAELRAAIARRRERIWSQAATSLRLSLVEFISRGEVEARGQERARHFIAHRIDRLSPLGLGCVHSVGDHETVLQFDDRECNPARLDQVVPSALRPALKDVGFRRVQCHNGSAGADL